MFSPIAEFRQYISLFLTSTVPAVILKDNSAMSDPYVFIQGSCRVPPLTGVLLHIDITGVLIATPIDLWIRFWLNIAPFYIKAKVNISPADFNKVNEHTVESTIELRWAYQIVQCNSEMIDYSLADTLHLNMGIFTQINTTKIPN